MLNAVFWLPTLSDHMVHLMRALCRLPDIRLRVIAATTSLPARVAQGWTVSSWNDIPHVVLPERGWHHQAKVEMINNPDALHIFGGMWSDRRFIPLFVKAVVSGLPVGLIMEPYADVFHGYHSEVGESFGRLIKSIRPVLYRFAGAGFGSRVRLLFAISSKAEQQYREAGFRTASIFPFGYFTPRLGECIKSSKSCVGRGLRTVFVGAMISRKGTDVAETACRMARAVGTSISLDLYGPGQSADSHPITDGVRYLGPIPFGHAQEVISEYDLLIVPSRFDGWGVIVNEALLQGVPVAVSHRAGASVLVERSGAGFLFDPADPEALAVEFGKIAAFPEILETWRRRAISYAPLIAPVVAATYTRDCLRHVLESAPRPTPPWYGATLLA